MKTIIKTEILKPNKVNILRASKELASGNLVGIPTETVYGLGANAFDSQAIDKVFVAKNRPQDNPLIVHIHKDYNIYNLVTEVTPVAEKLIKKFTPGPLTLVFKSKGAVSEKVSRGLSTIAIRWPDNDVAIDLLKTCNLPIAAPSANISSRMSATTAKEVKDELDGKLGIILDGGKCDVGIESTVVDVTGQVPVILRPGKITKEMLEKVVGNVLEVTTIKRGQKVKSPGMKYKHYSPSIPVYVGQIDDFDWIKQKYQELVLLNTRPVILCVNKHKKHFVGKNVVLLGKKSSDVAKNIYSTVRECEKTYDSILIYPLDKDGMGDSVMNRINKMQSK